MQSLQLLYLICCLIILQELVYARRGGGSRGRTNARTGARTGARIGSQKSWSSRGRSVFGTGRKSKSAISASRASHIVTGTHGSGDGNTYSNEGTGSKPRALNIQSSIASIAGTHHAHRLLLASSVAHHGYLNYHGHKYYWNDAKYQSDYSHGSKSAQQCQFVLNDRSQPLGNVFLNNNQHRIEKLYFRCEEPAKQYCCGLECCDFNINSYNWGTEAFEIGVALMIAVAVCGKCAHCLKGKFDERFNRQQVTDRTPLVGNRRKTPATPKGRPRAKSPRSPARSRSPLPYASHPTQPKPARSQGEPYRPLVPSPTKSTTVSSKGTVNPAFSENCD